MPQDGKYVRTAVSVDLPEFPPTRRIVRAEVSKSVFHKPMYGYFNLEQVKPGTGFVCEPYEGRKDKTLVTQLVHVCCCSNSESSDNY